MLTKIVLGIGVIFLLVGLLFGIIGGLFGTYGLDRFDDWITSSDTMAYLGMCMLGVIFILKGLSMRKNAKT